MKKQKAKITVKDLKARKDVKGGSSHLTIGHTLTGGHTAPTGTKPTGGSSTNSVYS